MIRMISTLLGDHRGTSITEMALIAPVLASMMIGIVDLSGAYSEKIQLEQAAQQAIEKVQAGAASASVFRTLQDEAAAAAGVAASDVNVEYWLECNGARMGGDSMDAAFQKHCMAGQTYARFVEVGIAKTYTPLFGAKFLGANEDGTYTLRAEAGTRLQ